MALDLPAARRTELAAWRDELIATRDDLRPVAEEALHVTLVFLGYRPEKEIDAIAAAIAGAASTPAPRLRPAAVVPLPAKRPRLFALELDDEGGAAVTLQGAISAALEAGRFYTPEKRPFWPHVTLARAKRDRRAAPLVTDTVPGEPFTATELTLYRSTLRPQGARYEPLACVRLG